MAGKGIREALWRKIVVMAELGMFIWVGLYQRCDLMSIKWTAWHTDSQVECPVGSGARFCGSLPAARGFKPEGAGRVRRSIRRELPWLLRQDVHILVEELGGEVGAVLPGDGAQVGINSE